MSLNLSIGTRSLLFGAHQLILHPVCLAIAWTKLYGFPCDFRLWIAFLVHDWGYYGKRDMDGAEGQTHPELGANIMGYLFGDEWRRFCLYHSRFYSKQAGADVSRLCIVDKKATSLVPWWVYLPMVKFTGELDGYMSLCHELGNEEKCPTSPRVWHSGMLKFLNKYVDQHKDLPEISMPQCGTAA